MTLPHSNLAPSELNKLRQQAILYHGGGETNESGIGQGKQERSASTSTSGYAGSNESYQMNNAINLVGNSLTAANNCAGKINLGKVTRSKSVQRSQDEDIGIKTGARPKSSQRSSLTLAGENVLATASSPSDKKSDKIAKYLSNSKRRASRPFLRAKTLLSDKF